MGRYETMYGGNLKAINGVNCQVRVVLRIRDAEMFDMLHGAVCAELLKCSTGCMVPYAQNC
jgi:hypothetical protein